MLAHYGEHDFKTEYTFILNGKWFESECSLYADRVQFSLGTYILEVTDIFYYI